MCNFCKVIKLNYLERLQISERCYVRVNNSLVRRIRPASSWPRNLLLLAGD